MRVRFLHGVPFCKVWTYSLMVKRASKMNARFLVSTPSVFVIHHAPSINNGGYGSISCFSPRGCVRLCGKTLQPIGENPVQIRTQLQREDHFRARGSLMAGRWRWVTTRLNDDFMISRSSLRHEQWYGCEGRRRYWFESNLGAQQFFLWQVYFWLFMSYNRLGQPIRVA